MVKAKGLGRGLDALLGGDTPSRATSGDAVGTLPGGIECTGGIDQGTRHHATHTGAPDWRR